MRIDWLRISLFGFLAIISQILLFRHLSFYGAQADPVLVFLLWTALKRDRTEVLIITAIASFFQDALLDLWGLNMFAKTLTLFIAHGYIRKASDFQPVIWQVFFGLIVVVFMHNLIVLILSSFVQLYATEYIPISFLIGSSLYTALVGTAAYVLTKN